MIPFLIKKWMIHRRSKYLVDKEMYYRTEQFHYHYNYYNKHSWCGDYGMITNENIVKVIKDDLKWRSVNDTRSLSLSLTR